MSRPISKKEIDILEQRGLWKASSVLRKLIKRLVKKNMPIEIGYLKNAHQTIFTTAKQEGIAGKYRQDNPELKKLDGSLLELTHWKKVPHEMAILNDCLKRETKNLNYPETAEDYQKIISLAAKLSHKLACIHPFENGNGRTSRLLINSILLRADLSEIAIKVPKPDYLNAMQQADCGDFSLLENLILDSLIDARKKRFNSLKINR